MICTECGKPRPPFDCGWCWDTGYQGNACGLDIICTYCNKRDEDRKKAEEETTK